jgi:hypothetical protein
VAAHDQDLTDQRQGEVLSLIERADVVPGDIMAQINGQNAPRPVPRHDHANLRPAAFALFICHWPLEGNGVPSALAPQGPGEARSVGRGETHMTGEFLIARGQAAEEEPMGNDFHHKVSLTTSRGQISARSGRRGRPVAPALLYPDRSSVE